MYAHRIKLVYSTYRKFSTNSNSVQHISLLMKQTASFDNAATSFGLK